MAKTLRYLVTGIASFPNDMLRYDNATVVGHVYLARHQWHVIESRNSPTVGRWRSFMWSVAPMKIQDAQWFAQINGAWVIVPPLARETELLPALALASVARLNSATKCR